MVTEFSIVELVLILKVEHPRGQKFNRAGAAGKRKASQHYVPLGWASYLYFGGKDVLRISPREAPLLSGICYLNKGEKGQGPIK
jgi:hypothetical protein